MNQPDLGRHPILTSLMVIFGILLLAPGFCALVFIFSDGFPPSGDSQLILLWAVCFLISVGGIWLLVKAFR
jgi:hypothetical protein